ncbi:MAG TPA: hypothetical protein VFG28_06320 [Syntrophales bacterium]|nr:hypothetical protein [Syntrophales bacterium]
MKRMIGLLTVSIVSAVLLAGLAGCSMEPRSATMHEPGVYKGEKDQVLALQNQQVLIDRLKLVQTDR